MTRGRGFPILRGARVSSWRSALLVELCMSWPSSTIHRNDILIRPICMFLS